MSEASLWNYDAARWPYGYAKHRTEMAVMEAVAAGLRAVIVNPSVVLGPGDVHRREDSIVELIAHRSLPPLIPPGGLNAIHIQDVLDGMLAARQRGVPGRRYILGGENVSIPDFIARISRAVGIDRRYREIPASLFQLAGIIGGLIDRLQVLPVPTSMLAMAGMHFYYDTGRMNGELKVQASRPIEQAALEAHAWYSHRSSHTAGR